MRPTGIPLQVQPISLRSLVYDALRFKREVMRVDGTFEPSRFVARAGLVLFPTSLCSGQIAAIIADSVRNYNQGKEETHYMKLLSDSMDLLICIS